MLLNELIRQLITKMNLDTLHDNKYDKYSSLFSTFTTNLFCLHAQFLLHKNQQLFL